MRNESSRRWRQVPGGVRDLAPPDAGRRAALAAEVRKEFARWGYREVQTPALEYLDTIVRGAGPGIQDALFKISDSGGELLALRPEMTVPIARLAATRLLPQAGRPLRLCYVAEVYRGQEAAPGRLRAFTQAGVELLGEPGLDADAEVIALAVESLRRLGAQEVLVNVGHLGLLDDLLDGRPEEARDEIRRRLYRKEFVGIEHTVEDRALAALLRILPDLHGPGVFEKARALATSPRSRAALDDLMSLMDRLRDYGVDAAVVIDLSIIRDFSYYTGVVFEAYGPEAGYPLLGGGRYDTLLNRFGVDCPATGFAIGLDRVLGAASDPPAGPDGVLIHAGETARRAAVQLAGEVRRAGVSAVLIWRGTWDQAVARARADGLRHVIRLEDGDAVVFDARTRTTRRLRVETVARELAPAAEGRVVEWTH